MVLFPLFSFLCITTGSAGGVWRRWQLDPRVFLFRFFRSHVSLCGDADTLRAVAAFSLLFFSCFLFMTRQESAVTVTAKVHLNKSVCVGRFILGGFFFTSNLWKTKQMYPCCLANSRIGLSQVCLNGSLLQFLPTNVLE